MSLDVYLTISGQPSNNSSGIFVRENGQKREISLKEWNEKFPDCEPVIATRQPNCVFSANITHNLTEMADKAGIYEAVWRPKEIGISKAGNLIDLLRSGLSLLEANPEWFQNFNPANGWGTYEGLVKWVRAYLQACQKYPDAIVSVSR